MNTLQNMKAFVLVTETGSLVGASRSLGVSTAQVSRLIADLEEHLNTRLLFRTTRRVTPTAAGERYAAKAREILAAVSDAESEASGAHVKAAGVLRLHCIASFALHHIIPLLARYRKENPDVSIELTLSQRVPKLTAEGFDMALALSPATQEAHVMVRRIATSYAILCATPAYLKKHGVPKRPSDLTAHTCLQLELPGIADGWSFHGPDGVEAVAIRPPFTVNVAEAMLRAVREGLGIGMLPGYSAAAALKSGELVRVLPDYRMSKFNIFALSPSRRFLDAKIGTFLDFLDKHLPASMEADRRVLEPATKDAKPAKSRSSRAGGHQTDSPASKSA